MPTPTLDAVGPNSSGFTTITTPYSWTHAVASDATLLLVFLACGTDGRALTVTAGGISMTTFPADNRWKRHSNDSTSGFGQWYALPAPPTGSVTIAISGQTTGDRISGGSLSYKLTALDSTAYGVPVSAVGSSAAPAVSISSSGAGTLAAFVVAGQGTTAVGGTSTSRFVAAGDTNSAAGNASGQTAPSTGSAVSMSATLSSSDFWAMFAVEVFPPGPVLPPRPQPGGRSWRQRFRRQQAQYPNPSGDMSVAGPVMDVQVAMPPGAVAVSGPPGPPLQWGGQSFWRQWRKPQIPIRATQQVPYITGVAGGGTGWFTDQFGTPRLVWGNALWALTGNVGRWSSGAWAADYDAILATHSAQGINVIYGKPMGTTQSGNIDDNGVTFDGLYPFQGGNPSTGTAGANPSSGLTEAYWQRIDYFLDAARKAGITWFCNAIGYNSDFNGGPGPLNGKSAAEFTAYGTALGLRYKNTPNLLWVIADDYFGSADNLLDAFKAGLAAAGDAHAITCENFPETTSRLLLDGSGTHTAWGFANGQFNFVYSYQVIYFGVELGYTADGTVPVIAGDGYFYQGGPTYQGGTSFAFDRNFRQEAWWALTSGARGKIHGDEGMWQWPSTAQSQAATGWFWVNNSKNIRAVVEALPGWQNLIPDTGSAFVTSGRGTHSTYTTAQYESSTSDSYVTASITPDGTLALVYLSHGSTITVNTALLPAGFTAQWIDPVTGAKSNAGTTGTYNSTAKGNNSQGDPDWALVFTGTPQPPAVPSVDRPLQPGSQQWRRRWLRDQVTPVVTPAGTDFTVAGAVASVTVAMPAGSVSVTVAGVNAAIDVTAPPGSASASAGGAPATVTVAMPSGGAAVTVGGADADVTVAMVPGTVSATAGGATAAIDVTAPAGSVFSTVPPPAPPQPGGSLFRRTWRRAQQLISGPTGTSTAVPGTVMNVAVAMPPGGVSVQVGGSTAAVTVSLPPGGVSVSAAGPAAAVTVAMPAGSLVISSNVPGVPMTVTVLMQPGAVFSPATSVKLKGLAAGQPHGRWSAGQPHGRSWTAGEPHGRYAAGEPHA